MSVECDNNNGSKEKEKRKLLVRRNRSELNIDLARSCTECGVEFDGGNRRRQGRAKMGYIDGVRVTGDANITGSLVRI